MLLLRLEVNRDTFLCGLLKRNSFRSGKAQYAILRRHKWKRASFRDQNRNVLLSVITKSEVLVFVR